MSTCLLAVVTVPADGFPASSSIVYSNVSVKTLEWQRVRHTESIVVSRGNYYITIPLVRLPHRYRPCGTHRPLNRQIALALLRVGGYNRSACVQCFR